MAPARKWLFAVAGVIGLLGPAPAGADTKLSLVVGSKEFEQLQQAIAVSAPEALYLQWSTDAPGAAWGSWQVTTKNPANQVTVVAKGVVPLSPIPGRVNRFSIAADAFLAPVPPAKDKAYSIAIQATDATKSNPLGNPSAPVVVTQGPASPPPKIIITKVVYPAVKFLRYVNVPSPYATGSLEVLVSNPGNTPTDGVMLYASDRDDNVLSDDLMVPSLKPKASMGLALKMRAHMPPPPGGLFDPGKLEQAWAQSMHDKGVDLDAVLNWRQSEFKKTFLYKGKTDSCQDGVKDGDETAVDCGGSCGFNRIEFTIRTGGDDLRGNSSVTATLMSANGTILQVLPLKDQDQSGWNNGATSTVARELKPPRPLCDIQHVLINLQSHNGPTQTDDNWNVQSVKIDLSINGADRLEFLAASGDPLQRLTKSLPSLVIDSPLCHRNVLGRQEGTGRLKGFVDLHTHPMTNVGFGGKLFYGGLDVGSYLPTDPDCHHNVRALCMQQALGHDNSTHGGFGLDNSCGDYIRAQVIHKTQQQNNSRDQPDDARGAPDFSDWPAWDDLLHQKMWVDWVRRSYEGGLRVMVALAVNNKSLGDMTAGPGDMKTDDRTSADFQLSELKAFVARHTDFMGIANSPEELEKIVRENKLAVVLGIEVDAIGNFYGKTPVTNPEISAEIDRLFGEGVRYIFPIHRLDNPFGGAAVYDPVPFYSNARETGRWPDLRCEQGFNFEFQSANNFLFDAAMLLKLGIIEKPPKYPPCPPGSGQANSRGLTEQGKFAIKEMMRHGMLIDVDHMSELSQSSAIALARGVGAGYPMNSGHNVLRVLGPKSGTANERSMPAARYAEIGKLHGMAGIGIARLDAQAFLTQYQDIVKAMGPGAVAGFGTDTNGLAAGMPPRPNSAVHYSDDFPRSSLGTRWWDYNKDGVAHYGMLPDLLEDVRTLAGGKEVVDDGLMFGADYFLQTWKKCVAEKGKVH